MNFNFISIGSLIDSKEASLQTGPFGTQLKASEYVEFGTPVINVRNIGFGDIRADNLEYITDFKAEQLKNHILFKGDIVFGRKGAVERHSYIQDEQVGWVQGSDCLRLRLNTQEVDSRFLSYYFKTQPHQDWMHALCAFGATMASLNQDIVRRILFPCPSIPVQRKIVAILSTYDDLIENNKKRIQILENMAEELYKEWFVRFRFPNWENTEFEKGVPKDWTYVNLLELADITYGYAFDSSKFNTEGIGKKIIRIRNIPISRSSDYTDEVPHDKYLIQTGDFLVGMDGDFHMNRWFDEESYLVQRSCRIKSKLNIHSAYIRQAIKAPIHFFQSTILGATVGHLGAKHLNSIEILIPNSEHESLFLELNRLDELILNLELQNRKLEVMRDSLLPRLISGKLSVENLDIHFPPSMQEQ
ncbi:restriction endonuclease subunit S [Acinetobacter sp. A2]|uniref:restriction endonuclease subunit S n=1 Tax=Acinetobacter sp. A2 TaxID=362457 RepID=UPI003AF4005C